MDNLSSYFDESLKVKEAFKEECSQALQEVILETFSTLKRGNKVLVAGNGGSAADAQHFAAELVGRYKKERVALPAIALTTDTSNLTAIGNDYGYDVVFSRQVEGLGNEGDVLFVISTSGNSPNLIKAVEVAQERGIKTIGLLGKSGGELKELCDISLVIPSNNTPRIQENHIFAIHCICEEVENNLFLDE